MLRTRFLLAIGVALIAIPAVLPAQSAGTAIEVAVVDITDGDTVQVLGAGGRFLVRIHGVDAPEGPQPFGHDATAFAARTLLDTRVVMTPRGTDRHDRIASAERRARDARRGLWSASSPQPPWDFRRTEPRASSREAVAYRGNRNSRVFHAPGCVDYECPNCSIALGSIDDARTRGFRPHTACVR